MCDYCAPRARGSLPDVRSEYQVARAAVEATSRGISAVRAFDACGQHVGVQAWSACIATHVWPILAQAKMTRLLQPLDTHTHTCSQLTNCVCRGLTIMHELFPVAVSWESTSCLRRRAKRSEQFLRAAIWRMPLLAMVLAVIKMARPTESHCSFRSRRHLEHPFPSRPRSN